MKPRKRLLALPFLKCVWVYLIAPLIFTATAHAQSPTFGTLTLVMANRNGYVIASDSRQSSGSALNKIRCVDKEAFYCDNSQKLFKTGEKSSIAISGFSSALKGTPLELQVASVLRQRYKYLQSKSASEKWSPPKGARPAMTIAETYVREFGPDDPKMPRPESEDFELEEALTTVAAAAPNNIPNGQLNFQTLTAKFDAKGVSQINRIDYEYVPRRGGPRNIMLPDYQAVDVTAQFCHVKSQINDNLKIKDFKFCTAGIDGLAKKVLNGDYATTNRIILKYYRALKKHKLDKIPLSQLAMLAHSILGETEKSPDVIATVGSESFSVVGGPDQLGIFPRRGRAVCCGEDRLPADLQLLYPKFLRAGFAYDGAKNGTPVNAARMSFFWSGRYDPDKPVHQVFIGDYFRNVTVQLDGNYFVDNRFDEVTFRYEGGDCFMQPPPRNVFVHCNLELHGSVTLPESCRSLSDLPNLGTYGLHTSGTIVGSPIRVEMSKCREPHPDGTVTLWYRGECGDTAAIIGPEIR